MATTTATTTTTTTTRRRRRFATLLFACLAVIQSLLVMQSHGFSPRPTYVQLRGAPLPNLPLLFVVVGPQKPSMTLLHVGSFSSLEDGDDENDDDDDDDDDDDYIDMESLGDWRTFRRTLAMGGETLNGEDNSTTTSSSSSSSETVPGESPQASKATTTTKTRRPQSVSKDNEEVLRSQNKKLSEEYMTGVWAHETSTPEVGGLVVRMPLEVELFRNHRHSLMGRRLKDRLDSLRSDNNNDDATTSSLEMSTWYARAKKLVEEEMRKIAALADDEGQIDATRLKEEASEMLSLYLDNQETWQEVCLVVEHAGSDEEEGNDGDVGTSKTVVLNRPMAFQLTENLGRLVLFGAFQRQSNGALKEGNIRKDLKRFMMAFQNECAVYVGGPDEQGNPALMIHGIPDLPGAIEISTGSKIYQGGLPAAIDGVLEGKYSPLEFRFFVGCHTYEESALDVAVHLGKYQPVACARSVALKQCISLPKPLWHEVTELCGGDLADLSSLELLKRSDLQFQVLDETEYDDDDDDEIIEIEIEIDDDDDDFLQ